MKPIKILLITFIVTAFAAVCQAVTDSHRAAIEHLFTVLKIDKQYESGMIAGFEAAAGATPEQLATMTEDQRAKFQAGMAKVKAKMIELMGWEKVKPDMIELYARHFSETEINDIAKMMETPTGQLLVSKQLALIPESMSVAQKKAQAIMPEISKIMQDAMQ
jgi:hypothetical protein